jgi:hypothetical protein
MRITYAAFFVVGLVISGCGTNQPPKPVPAYLLAESSCAIVISGAVGDNVADRRVAEFWAKANAQIGEFLQGNLQDAKYRSIAVPIAVSERQNISEMLANAAAKNECNRVIQLAHTIGTAPSGNFFQFDVTMLRLQPESSSSGAGTKAVTVKIFSKEYRYPRTAESLDQFHTGDFANKIFNDLKQSGQLDRLR